MDFTIKVGAAAGEGAFVTGKVLGKLFARGGYHVFGYPEYPSLIRGGHNSYQVRISDGTIESPRRENNIILVLNPDAYAFHIETLAKDGVIIVDKSFAPGKDERELALPIADLIKEAGGDMRMKNTLLVGVTLGLVGYPLEMLEQLLEEIFGSKGEEVVNANKRVARAGYEIGKDHKKWEIVPKGEPKYYIAGNEAAGLGALSAGLRFYSGYPMTPASSLLHFLISKRGKLPLAVVQSEDEIAAINQAIGAAYAGVRAMTGSSGGGFALMTEAVGLAALAEIPLVVYLAQRTGPSTGMPTWTEQADLFQVLGASQGEFLRIVLAPTSIPENYRLTGEALNLAEKYQVPVFVLVDKFLAESNATLDSLPPIPIERGPIILEDMEELPLMKRYPRYKDTETGVSPRPVPGVRGGYHIGTSYEHREDSFTTEDFDERKKQVDKRMRKLAHILNESYPPIVEGNGRVAVVAWGSQKGPVFEGAKKYKRIAFNWVYPLDKEKVKKAFEGVERIVVFENNATGLFSKLLYMETGIKPDALVLKYTGRQFFPEQVEHALEMLEEKDFQSPDPIRYEEDFEKYEFYAPWRYKVK
ncbi:MAG: 2-oxoacid:acceptor oxidoreductase subunit alpha [Candidatus Micrarchaeota archaeon]|nr:2-oxoacid:acceptor oxidoreductase subunit alpha [Candidatus Micrarchaeota archaeon]